VWQSLAATAQIEARIANMAVTVVVITALALLVGGWQFNPLYELHGAARVLATAQQQGSVVAHVGAYNGQYHFAGRLTKPLEIVPRAAELWALGHPDGLIGHLRECLAATAGAGALPLTNSRTATRSCASGRCGAERPVNARFLTMKPDHVFVGTKPIRFVRLAL